MFSHREKLLAGGTTEPLTKKTTLHSEQMLAFEIDSKKTAEVVEQNKLLKAQLAFSEQLLKKVAQWAETPESNLPQTLGEQLRESVQDSSVSLSRAASKESISSGAGRLGSKSGTLRTEEELARKHSQNIEKRIKVALADSEFEVKRLNEDFALYKTMHELERAKLTKQFEGRISALKAQLDEDNQNWINRFDIRDKEFKAEGELLKQHLEKDKLKVKGQFEKEVLRIKKQLQEKHCHTLKEQQHKYSCQAKKLQTEREADLQKVMFNHEAELKELRVKHDTDVQRMRRQNQIMLVAVRSERKSEQNMHEQTKAEMNRIKQKLYSQLYSVRKDNDLLGMQVARLEKDKKALQGKLEDERQHLVKVLEKNESTLANLRQQYESREDQLKQMMKSKMAEMLEKQLVKAEQLGTNIKVLEQRHSEQVEIFSTQMQQIKNCYEQRPSRQEDLQMIRQLEERLWKKENDLELVCQELKWHRLELENKEQTYNKIFTNGYNVNVNELKFPAERSTNRTATKEFKFRRVAKSLLTKDPKNSSGKLLQTNIKIL